MNQTVQIPENYKPDLAVERAIGAYVQSRKEKVPDFVIITGIYQLHIGIQIQELNQHR